MRNGELILFPSYLRHSVPINTSDDVRVSISFNTFADNIGSEKDLTELIKNKADGQITQKQADNILAKVASYTQNQSEELFTAISDFTNADVIRESDVDFLSKLRNTLKGPYDQVIEL